VQYARIDYVIIDTKHGDKVPTKYRIPCASIYRVDVLNVARSASKQKCSTESMYFYFAMKHTDTSKLQNYMSVRQAASICSNVGTDKGSLVARHRRAADASAA
jgi:hypothetical protein